MSRRDWVFRERSAATLERVVPISQVRHVDGDFTVALTSMEVYGDAGCIVHYLIDVYSMKIADPGACGPENFRGEYHWSDTNHDFSVRDQSGREYSISLEGGGSSGWGDGTESYEGAFSVEPLASDAQEVTVELESIERESCYHYSELTDGEERFLEELWTGPISFTFAAEQKQSAMSEDGGGPGRQAARLKRVIPVSQLFEVEGEFVVVLASLEDYGESGCVIRYALDFFGSNLKDGRTARPVAELHTSFDNVEPAFEIRDQGGHIYGSAMGSGLSRSFGADGTEFRHAHFGFEPLRPEAESLTVTLKSIVRTTRSYDFPLGRDPGDETGETVETLWEGPYSFTFAVR